MRSVVVEGWSPPPEDRFDTCFIRLDDEDKHRLRKNLSVIDYDPGGGDDYLAAVQEMMHASLPRAIVKLLAEQKDRRKARPFLVFDNLPVSEKVITSPPAQGVFPQLKSGCLSENLAVGFARLIGEPYSIAYEGDGVVNNVVPKKALARAHTSQGFDVALEFHTEHPALKHYKGMNLSPNGLVVTGVRRDPHGPRTWLADVPETLATMSAPDLATLRRPVYSVRSPERWKECAPAVDVSRHRVPLVFEENSAMQVCAAFFPNTVKPLNWQARMAFENFHKALKRNALGLKLEPGRLVYINNDRTVHARERFDASFDQWGNGLRWVQRVCVTHDLGKQQQHFRAVKPRVFELPG